VLLWVYRDYRDWCEQLTEAAQKRQYDVRQFTDASQVEGGYAFIHMHHHPDVRQHDRESAFALAHLKRSRMIPTSMECAVYDDKYQQMFILNEWLPKTWFFTDAEQALSFAGNRQEWPIVSKANVGAGSHNVRLLRSANAAMEEVRQAFFNGGVPIFHGLKQKGYLYWQEFLPENDCDYRVIRIGRESLVLKRYVRSAKRPFASGSGKIEPVRDLRDGRVKAAHEVAWEFFNKTNSLFSGVDVVFKGEKPYILETTVGWTLAGYKDCKFIRSGKSGSEFWNVFLDELEAGAFGAPL